MSRVGEQGYLIIIQKLTSYRVGGSTTIKDAASVGTIKKLIPINKEYLVALEFLLIALRSALTIYLLIRS